MKLTSLEERTYLLRARLFFPSCFSIFPSFILMLFFELFQAKCLLYTHASLHFHFFFFRAFFLPDLSSLPTFFPLQSSLLPSAPSPSFTPLCSYSPLLLSTSFFNQGPLAPLGWAGERVHSPPHTHGNGKSLSEGEWVTVAG